VLHARFTRVLTPGGTGGAGVLIQAIRALGLRLAPLLIPESEALDMHLNRYLEPVRPGNALDHERTRDEAVAGVALFSVAWTDPESGDAVQRQTTVLELLESREEMPDSPEVSTP
jgi:hypothetical protein